MVGATFAAVVPSSDAKAAVAEAVKELDIPGRLSPVENWHITLRYLGVVDQVTYERFLHGLGGVGECDSFRISLGGLGAFPTTRRATVVWVGIDRGKEGLETLAGIAEDAAQSVGLAPEDRPYRPHMTLSRVRPPADVTALQAVSVRARWSVDRVVVFRTVAGRGGARYEPLETVPLRV